MARLVITFDLDYDAEGQTPATAMLTALDILEEGRASFPDAIEGGLVSAEWVAEDDTFDRLRALFPGRFETTTTIAQNDGGR